MSQNATELVRLLRTLIFFLKTDEFFEKKMNNLKIGKICKFVAEYDKNSQSSQNVQNLIFFKKN